jgi:hypothetical protein
VLAPHVAGTQKISAASQFRAARTCQPPRYLFIMPVPGRLVQLVRILGRHPRGRRFESCTAHQNFQTCAQDPRDPAEKRCPAPFLCWPARPDFPPSPSRPRKTQQLDIPPTSLLRQDLLRAILAGFGMDPSFFRVHAFLVVKLAPPNRRWEWRKNEPGPSRSQGWYDAHLHG